MKRLGPELKKPELKVPPVFRDLYNDLRDRRLLPLVAFLLVAIVAVPFLLGEGPEEAPEDSPQSEAGAGAAQASHLTVVQATPGLRDYRKRLRGRTPSDPFKPHYSGPVLKGAQLNDPVEGEASGGSAASPDGGGSSVGVEGGTGDDGEAPPSGDGRDAGLTVVAWSVDVGISRSGGATEEARQKSERAEPYVKRDVLPQTALPSEEAPVVTYLGPAREGTGVAGKALFLVSRDVVSVFGDVYCAEGDEVCQLVEVEPGMAVSFVYGQSEVTYTIVVRSIDPVTTSGSSK